jgi:hypothetical protein
MQDKEPVTAKSYTVYTENGSWLGQIILTSDGTYTSVTDYGNFAFAWRHWGKEDFRQFICGLNVDYFATKMYCGMSYVVHGKKIEQACDRYAKHILPPLQKLLKEELASTHIPT